MGFKIEKPAPDVLKCARAMLLPSIPGSLVHLLSALRPENDRDTSGRRVSVASRSEVDYCAVRSDRESSRSRFLTRIDAAGEFRSRRRGRVPCISGPAAAGTAEGGSAFPRMRLSDLSQRVFLTLGLLSAHSDRRMCVTTRLVAATTLSVDL